MSSDDDRILNKLDAIDRRLNGFGERIAALETAYKKNGEQRNKESDIKSRLNIALAAVVLSALANLLIFALNTFKS